MILPTRRTTCADDPRNWPPALRDEFPTLRSRLTPLRDQVAIGQAGTYYDEGEAYTAWRDRRAVSTAAVARRRDDAAAD